MQRNYQIFNYNTPFAVLVKKSTPSQITGSKNIFVGGKDRSKNKFCVILLVRE